MRQDQQGFLVLQDILVLKVPQVLKDRPVPQVIQDTQEHKVR